MPGRHPGAPQRDIPHQETPGRDAPHLTIEVTVSAGTATVILHGELDPVTMPQLALRLARVLADEPQQLILDLADVSFIDCASARLITGTGRHLPAGARPLIRLPSLAVRRLLILTGLADHLEMVPAAGEQDALGLPGVPFQAGLGQLRRPEERGRCAEVERADR
jgi:anti-sigma B factor antagonist